MAGGRTFGGPWVGRSYAHVVLPRPQVDESCCALLDEAVLHEPGWRVVDPQAPPPVLFRRWRHDRGATLLVVVLGWYPMALTVGSDQRAGARVRRAKQRIVDASLRAGGRVVADRELERLLGRAPDRWQRAVAAHAAIERQLALTERRQCGCGTWSAYAAVHCSGCGSRFGPHADAERDERGRTAGEQIARAQEELQSLGRGNGLFADWPRPSDQPADLVGTQREVVASDT